MKDLSVMVAVALILTVACSYSRHVDTPVVPMTLDAPVAPTTLNAPKATEVVATLETLIPEGKNAIWCASFLAAWKTLMEQVTQEPVSLEGQGGLVPSLNSAPDPRPAVPQAALYVASGWKQEGIIERVQRELVQKFPSKQAPTFPGAISNSFIAYSYLEASVKFSLPYFQNRQALEFTDAEGRKTPVVSFGIRPEDDYAYYKLRAQPQILFRKGEEREESLEFAIDLCPDSEPSQIVVARINREPTLAAAVARVDMESEEMDARGRGQPDYAKHLQKVGPNDVLLVPNLFWQLSHHFSELEGKKFTNAKLKGQQLDVAQQDILFRLDRSGAELKSESKMLCSPIPTYFVLDRPYLIFLRQRGAQAPYFAMWVDNSELLSNWQKESSPQLDGATNGNLPTATR
jgi:hypothetical protein